MLAVVGSEKLSGGSVDAASASRAGETSASEIFLNCRAISLASRSSAGDDVPPAGSWLTPGSPRLSRMA